MGVFAIYLKKQEDGSLSGVFPDIPGISFKGSGFTEAHNNAEVAALNHFSDLSLAGKKCPSPSFIYDIDDLEKYTDGYWSVVFVREF